MKHPIRWLLPLLLLSIAVFAAACRGTTPSPTPTPLPPPPTALPIPTRAAMSMTATPTPIPTPSATPAPGTAAIRGNPLVTRTTPPPASATEEPEHIAGWAYVDVLRTALRDAPAGAAIATLNAGQRLDILSATGDRAWLYVRWQAASDEPPQEGWVRAGDVRYFVDPQDIPAPCPGGCAASANATPVFSEDQGEVTARKLNLRAGPGVDQPIIGKLSAGERVALLGRSDTGQWLKIQTERGGIGWAAAAWIKSKTQIQDLPVVGTATTGIPKPAPGPGGKIVFQDRPGGNIYIMNANGTDLRVLTTGLDPALSPDGKQVAFARWDGNGDAIRLINVDGSNEHFFLGTNKPRSPTWSPDGSDIVYERLIEDRICRETPLGCATDEQIRREFNGNDCWTYPPPIGTYCIWDFPKVHLLITDLEKFPTSETGQVETLPTLNLVYSPSYYPFGGKVVHLARKGIFVTYTDEDRRPDPIVQYGYLGPPIYSPDGRFIYVSKKDGDNWNIWRYNEDGSGPFALTHPPGLRDRPINNVAPAVSPDGRYILFLSDRNGPWQMWIMNSDGSHQRLFLPNVLKDIEFQFDLGRARMIDWK